MTEQLRLPLGIPRQEFTAFLEQWCALEDEADRVRTLLKELREQCEEHGLPMRGITAAIKIARTLRKVETHAKEPMSREHVLQLVVFVDAYLQELEEAKAKAIGEAMGEQE